MSVYAKDHALTVKDVSELEWLLDFDAISEQNVNLDVTDEETTNVVERWLKSERLPIYGGVYSIVPMRLTENVPVHEDAEFLMMGDDLHHYVLFVIVNERVENTGPDGATVSYFFSDDKRLLPMTKKQATWFDASKYHAVFPAGVVDAVSIWLKRDSNNQDELVIE